MLEEQTVLITILREVVSSYDRKIEALIKNNNSILLLNKGVIDNFRNDLDYITELDLTIVKKIFEELETPKEESIKIYNYLDSIKELLTLNKKENTSYEITKEQLSYVEKFFLKVDELEKKNQQTHFENLKKIAKMNGVRSKYSELLNQIEDGDNKKYISDLNLISLLLNEYELEEKTKRSILINIMKYNQKVNS